MADTKISALPASTTPLAGTEVLPIVQAGATVKVAVSDLTAGRAISATAVTVSTGNFVVGTSGQGVDFSATPGTGTSELLNDYEEGTWTPVVAGSTSAGTATYAIQNGRYTKVGRQVFIEFFISWSAGTGTGNMRITGLPFTAANSTLNPSLSIGLADFYALSANNVMTALVVSNSTRIELYQYPTGGGAANNAAYDTVAALAISGSYTV